MDNAVDGIIMLNLMDRAIDNKFKKINQTDPYYAQKLQEHAREKEINKNLKDMIMNLSYSMREPNENTLVLTNKLKETLNQPIKPQNQKIGVPTGGAAMIKDEKRTYSVNNPTNQKLFNKIKKTDEQLELLNNELEEINKSNKKITKKQLLKIFEELKDIISDIEKNYPVAKNIDKSEKKTFTLKVNTLSYWFDRVLNRLPEIFNNAKRVINKYKYYNESQKEDIKIVEDRIEEIEQLLPKTITSNISFGKKVIADIKYLIMSIIDNIRYRFIELEDEPIPQEILVKYPKPENMSKENEAIFEYNLRNLYNPEDIDELKKFLMRDDIEGYRDVAYKDINGVWTIGYGDTHGVVSGMKTNRNEAEKKLEENIKIASIPVVNYLKISENETKIPICLNQNQFDALVSISFNAGPGTVNKKIIVPYLSKGDYIGASEQIQNLTSDSYIGGLKVRRKLEYEYYWKDIDFLPNIFVNINK